MEKKLEEYNHILLRLERAEAYFEALSDDEIDNIEDSKEYGALKEILYKANELHMELKENSIYLGGFTDGSKY